LVKGGDGYPLSRVGGLFVTGTLMRDVLAWCAAERSPVRAAAADRITREP